MTVKVVEKEINGQSMYQIDDAEELTEEEFGQKYFLCELCDEWHEISDYVGHLDSGEKFCIECQEHYDIVECQGCGKYLYRTNMINVDGDCYCEDCLSNNDGADYDIFYCEECGNYHYLDDTDHVWFEDSGRYVCDNCLWGMDYWRCEDCGEYFEYDDSGEWIDDCWYCNNCAEHNRGVIASYHSMKNAPELIEFHPNDNRDNALHMGVELELAGGYGSVSEISEWVVDTFNSESFFFHPEQDGSVDVEIISEPATLEYWKTLEPKLDEFFEAIAEDKYNNDPSCGAGGHIHCDRKWFEAQTGFVSWGKSIAILEYIFKRYYYELLAFSNRPFPSAWGSSHRYYKRPQAYSADIGELVDRAIYDNNYEEIHDRYYALNISNKNTIEFRIFGPYDSTKRLFAYLKMAERLCTIAVTKSLYDIYFMKWTDILGDDADINAMWNESRRKFIDYISNHWRNISAEYRIMYGEENPEFEASNTLMIKEAI